MNELAIINNGGQIAERPMRLVEWAEEARAANALAQSLCQTPFAGQYKGDPMGATAAILKGAEVGLTPVTSLGAFDLIQGTPAPKAITLRALVQSRGHSVWIESSTDTECTAKARRNGEAIIHESRWTMKRAQQMGLTNKPNWKNQPAAMLMARATSEVCRLVAADVILGVGYSAEEVSDQVPEPVARVQRAKIAPPPMPDLDPEPPTLTADEPIPTDEQTADAQLEQPLTQRQSAALHASLADHGLSDREAGLAYISETVGRDVDSSKTLTKAEASQVIDRLKAEAAIGAKPPLAGWDS